MTDTQVAIVGGGLSGLNTARLIGEAGADFQLFEARDRLGGRILTVDEGPAHRAATGSISARPGSGPACSRPSPPSSTN